MVPEELFSDIDGVDTECGTGAALCNTCCFISGNSGRAFFRGSAPSFLGDDIVGLGRGDSLALLSDVFTGAPIKEASTGSLVVLSLLLLLPLLATERSKFGTRGLDLVTEGDEGEARGGVGEGGKVDAATGKPVLASKRDMDLVNAPGALATATAVLASAFEFEAEELFRLEGGALEAEVESVLILEPEGDAVTSEGPRSRSICCNRSAGSAARAVLLLPERGDDTDTDSDSAPPPPSEGTRRSFLALLASVLLDGTSEALLMPPRLCRRSLGASLNDE